MTRVVLFLLLTTLAAAQTERPRKLLFFTRNVGYYHDVVKRKGEALSLAERELTKLGRRLGIEVVCTKDGRVFDRPLDEFGVVAFFTNNDLLKPNPEGEPPMSPKGKERLLQAVRDGMGFMSFHSGCACWRTPGEKFVNASKLDPYIAMIGGEFIQHGPQQKATIRVASPEFPGLLPLGERFVLHEEWYATKNYAPDLHVLLAQETKGMKGACYERPAFPSTWVRRHGKGRVFTTTLAHREDTWQSPLFAALVSGGMRWAIGDEDHDTKPNLDAVTPGARTLRAKAKPAAPKFAGLEFLNHNARGFAEYRSQRDPSVVFIHIPPTKKRRRGEPRRAFLITRTEITNAQYLRACRMEGWLPPETPDYRDGGPPSSRPNHPVVNLSWTQARRYCRWLAGEAGGLRGDLPSDGQWLRAARGADGGPFPWGSAKPDQRHARFDAGWTGGPLPVGSLPSGMSACGTLDQAGNVWEWCRGSAPSRIARGRALRVVRGGSFASPTESLDRNRRSWWPETTRRKDLGFRAALTPRRGR